MPLEVISKIHSEQTDKPSIVLIHGACMGAWVWEGNFMDYFYAAGHSVYALSLSHHANSDGDGALRWTSIWRYVEDLREVVDSIAGPVFFIGHSMGGFTIQHYLKQPGKQVVGAALLCSAPVYGLWNLIGKLILHYPFHFFQSVIQMSWLPVMKDASRLKRVMFRKDFQEHQMSPVMSKLQDESFLAFLEMVFLRLPKLKRFPVPVLVVGAEKDYLISIKDTQRMARHYGVDALIVKDASHCLMLETGWEMVAEKIKSFAHQH